MEAIGLIGLGVAMCLCAALDWVHPSWGNRKRYWWAGVGMVGIGVLVFVVSGRL